MKPLHAILGALCAIAAWASHGQSLCSSFTSPFAPGACNPPKAPTTAAPAAAALSPQAALGKLLFNDVELSASRKQSCASCHAPATGFTAPDAAPVPLGGVNLDQKGLRNTPSAAYASFTPAFSLPAAGALGPNGGPLPPRGGQMRDGRFNSLAVQAQKPFTSSFEMANADAAQVVQRLRARPYAAQFTAVFGANIFHNPDNALSAIGTAIAAFESEGVEFHPFSSKFDAVSQGKATYTAKEAAGLAAFSDNAKGHCASCHTMTPTAATSAAAAGKALFTDFTYHALGVPRNYAIPFNNDDVALPTYAPANGWALGGTHKYYDLGLCGPTRTDLVNHAPLCGAFKVPSLRNAGLKRAYFHNGVLTSLSDVVSFYATRNRDPGRWYKRADGTPDELYNDLPPIYRGNVDPVNHPGGPIAPNLSPADMANVVAFLCTLNDGYDVANPAAYNAVGQCKGVGAP